MTQNKSVLTRLSPQAFHRLKDGYMLAKSANLLLTFNAYCAGLLDPAEPAVLAAAPDAWVPWEE